MRKRSAGPVAFLIASAVFGCTPEGAGQVEQSLKGASESCGYRIELGRSRRFTMHRVLQERGPGILPTEIQAQVDEWAQTLLALMGVRGLSDEVVGRILAAVRRLSILVRDPYPTMLDKGYEELIYLTSDEGRLEALGFFGEGSRQAGDEHAALCGNSHCKVAYEIVVNPANLDLEQHPRSDPEQQRLRRQFEALPLPPEEIERLVELFQTDVRPGIEAVFGGKRTRYLGAALALVRAALREALEAKRIDHCLYAHALEAPDLIAFSKRCDAVPIATGAHPTYYFGPEASNRLLGLKTSPGGS